MLNLAVSVTDDATSTRHEVFHLIGYPSASAFPAEASTHPTTTTPLPVAAMDALVASNVAVPLPSIVTFTRIVLAVPSTVEIANCDIEPAVPVMLSTVASVLLVSAPLTFTLVPLFDKNVTAVGAMPFAL